MAELNVGLRMLSLLLTLSGTAVALFFLSSEESLAVDPAFIDSSLLRFHSAYVSHFAAIAMTLLVGNLLLIGGLVYIQVSSGWSRAIVREFGLGKRVAKSIDEWRALFLVRLAEAVRGTERMEKIIFAGAALIVLIIPVQLAVVAAIVTIFRKVLT